MWKVFIFALFLSLSNPNRVWSAELNCLEAQNFRAIDFRKEFGPLRTQGGINWCFAFAGADLLTHWLYKKGEIKSLKEDDLVSATAMALNTHRIEEKEKLKKTIRIKSQLSDLLYASDDPESFFLESHNETFDIGGWAATASVEMAKKGICTEGRVRSSIDITPDLISRDFVERGDRADKLKILSRVTRMRDTRDAAALQALFPALSQNQIKKTLMTSKSGDVIFNLLDRSCVYRKTSVPTAKFQWIGDYPSRPEGLEDIFKTADQLIEDNRAVILSTTGEIFDSANLPFDTESGHAVILVGKRFNCNENEPEYVIRNSWGPTTCERYLSGFRRYTPAAEAATAEILARYYQCANTCTKFHNANEDFQSLRLCQYNCDDIANAELIKANNPPYYCENGYYIVRKSQLESVARGISYLE